MFNAPPLSPNHSIVTTGEGLTAMVREMRANPVRGVDFETSGTSWWKHARPVGYSCGYLGPHGPRAWYVPVAHQTTDIQCDPTNARAAFKDAFEGAERIVGHNLGFDVNMARVDGWDLPAWAPLDDTLIQAFLIYESRSLALENVVGNLQCSPYGDPHEMKELVTAYTQKRAKLRRLKYKDGEDAYLPRFGHAEVPVALEGEYSCRDIGHTLTLDRLQRSDAMGIGQPFEARRRVLYANEMLLVRALADMTWVGQPVDIDYLGRLAVDLDGYLSEHGRGLSHLFGTTIEWNNDGALRDLLYTRMKFPVPGFTPDGQPSVDRAALMALRHRHPGIEPLEEWRARYKVRSTYTTSLIEKVGDDGRLHGDFVQWGAGTGRLSSRAPNLQNIPARHAVLAAMVRRGFLIEPGKVRVLCDYSQIELRILAWVTGAANLLTAYESRAYMDLLSGRVDYEAYRRNRRSEVSVDVHGNVAREVFGAVEVPEGDPAYKVWKRSRSAAKIINFGVPYGGGPGLLQADPNLRLTEAEAKEYFEAYHRRNPEIGQTKQILFTKMAQQGYTFTNWAGRTRHGPRLGWTRQRGADCPVAAEERAMFASVVQGSAAELTRFSIVGVYLAQQRGELPGRQNVTVHDELGSDADRQHKRELALGMQKIMEASFTGCFGTTPVIADIETTETNWAEKAEYHPLEE